MRHSVPLEAAVEIERFGGKAVSLGQAVRGRLPVPAGIAVDWTAVEAVASGDAGALAVIAELALSVLERGVTLAVRSSAVAEDGAASSFAGIHETVLGVHGIESLGKALLAVFRSAQSDAALAYRGQLGICGPPRIAAVVQECVEPRAAGVMFTRCPLTGADHRLIEGAFGFGDAVVDGAITPDQFRLDATGQVLERNLGDKASARRLDRAAGRIVDEQLDGADTERLCLDNDDLAALHNLAGLCDRVYGDSRHDIEWAFAGDALYLLQRRPITT